VPQTSTPLKLPSGFIENMVYVNESSRIANNNQTQHFTTKEEALNKGTRFLSTKAVSMLNHWFQENRDYPYPDEATTDFLAKQAEISAKQVKKWFANKRVRSQMCCKPMNRNKRKSLNTSDSHELKQSKSLKKENNFSQSRDNSVRPMNVPVKEKNFQATFVNSARFNSSSLTNHQQAQNQNTIFATFIQEQYARPGLSEPHSSRLSLSDQQKNTWNGPSTPKIPQTINSTKARQLTLNTKSDKLSQQDSHVAVHQQNNSMMNTAQFNNALFLRSMSYLNPMLIMNILAASQSNLLNSSPKLSNKSNTAIPTHNISHTGSQEFAKEAIDNEEEIYRNSSSTSSNRSTSSSSHNEYENSEATDEKNENISVGSYENCNYSSENIDAIKLERMNKCELFNKHKTNQNSANCNIKLEKLDNTSESGSSSSASNFVENNLSLINSNLSPCSLSSSSYASSSSMVENNFNFTKNKSACEKKTNFAVISSLI